MNQTEKRENLQKYLFGGMVGAIMLVAVGALFCIAGFASAILQSDKELLTRLRYAGVGLLFLLVTFILASGTIKERRGFRAKLDKMEAEHTLDELLAEFDQAEPVLHDGMRLGTRHVFPHKNGDMIPYEQIVRVYQFVKKRNFIEVSRELCAVVANEKKPRTLCSLRKKKDEEELKRVVTMMLLKNPAIKVGYNT